MTISKPDLAKITEAITAAINSNAHQISVHRAEIDRLQGDFSDAREQTVRLDEKLNKLSSDLSVLTQRLNDLEKHLDKWESRFWAVMLLIIGGFVTIYLKK